LESALTNKGQANVPALCPRHADGLGETGCHGRLSAMPCPRRRVRVDYQAHRGSSNKGGHAGPHLTGGSLPQRCFVGADLRVCPLFGASWRFGRIAGRHGHLSAMFWFMENPNFGLSCRSVKLAHFGFKAFPGCSRPAKQVPFFSMSKKMWPCKTCLNTSPLKRA
jgi:hypothetical protein